jgi:hypothetical protein
VRARVEDCVRTGKFLPGVRAQPGLQVSVLIAATLLAWLRLLALDGR